MEELSFHLISLAGDAMSKLFEANTAIRLGETKKYNLLMEEARQLMNEAHNEQTKLLVAEAQGEKVDINVLLIHAQDTLMNTILAEAFTKELAKTNQKVAELEQRLSEIAKN